MFFKTWSDVLVAGNEAGRGKVGNVWYGREHWYGIVKGN